ncbi:MAG: GntR family transcriptional regulator [Rhizobiaceae bacterium]
MKDDTAKTHTMRAVIQLRDKIMRGELHGGMRLFEVSVADQLEISRTPVREAMSRLTEEGLLERVRSGGFVVRTFSLADVTDAIELRGVLEGTAARLAAERGVPAHDMERLKGIVAKLDDCFGELPEDVDFEGYAELNARFHHELARLSGSEMVCREVERITRLPFASPSAFLPDEANIAAFRRSLQMAQEQHHTIAAAIEAREGFRAESTAREHARAARRNLDYVMSQDRSLIERVPALGLLAG